MVNTSRTSHFRGKVMSNTSVRSAWVRWRKETLPWTENGVKSNSARWSYALLASSSTDTCKRQAKTTQKLCQYCSIWTVGLCYKGWYDVQSLHARASYRCHKQDIATGKRAELPIAASSLNPLFNSSRLCDHGKSATLRSTFASCPA